MHASSLKPFFFKPREDLLLPDDHWKIEKNKRDRLSLKRRRKEAGKVKRTKKKQNKWVAHHKTWAKNNKVITLDYDCIFRLHTLLPSYTQLSSLNQNVQVTKFNGFFKKKYPEAAKMITTQREMHAPWLYKNNFISPLLLECLILMLKALDITAKFYKNGLRGLNTSQSIGRMSVMQKDPNVPMMCLTSHPHFTMTHMFGEETKQS